LTRHTFLDEQNLVEWSAAVWSHGAHTRTIIDTTAQISPQGAPDHVQFVLALRKRSTIPTDQFRCALVALAETMASNQTLTKLRLHLLDDYNPEGWTSPGVAHAWAPDRQYHALVQIGFTGYAHARVRRFPGRGRHVCDIAHDARCDSYVPRA
jgi:hypothetical protein